MEIIELGGRHWRILETSTLQHLLWMDQRVAESGLAGLLQQAVTVKEAGEHAGRIWEQISKSGKALAFLGGMLMPEKIPDIEWTPARAEETMAFLEKLTAPEDHARIRSLLVSVVLGFFGVVRDSFALSLAVSGKRGQVAGTARATS